MKRCPECLFIYPDADTLCDFDGTALVVVNEAELDAATTQPKTASKRKRSTKSKRATKKRQRKATVITAIVGLLLGVAAFLIYYRFASRPEYTTQLQPPPIVQPVATPIPTPAPPETTSPSPASTPIPKPTTERIATAHTSTTVAPISTSGPGMGQRPGAKPVILLTSGAKLAADEVWRTRDGVWYRRDGIVTLLKRGQVKAIVNQ